MQLQLPIKKKRIPYSSIFVTIGCLLIILRVVLYSMPAKPAQAPVVNQSASSVSEKQPAISASASSELFRLTAGTAALSLPVTGGSLLSILTDVQKRGEITFSGKEYTGLGFFVTELGSLKEGDGKHLMYSINGKEASVGVSNYIPKTGDTVLWELK
jgi:hypothetical protein